MIVWWRRVSCGVFFYISETMCRMVFWFCFSSRRRHTRLTCDWSSDVCSSDLAGLDRPDRGEVRVDGATLDYGDDDALALWRRKNVGFVFQAFHLLPYLSVADNVALPLALAGVDAAERPGRVQDALAAVGLAGLAARRPGSLSGGEMQRAAIARALVHRPTLVLADEPTGNLDEANAAGVLDCLGDAVKRSGAAALMVTHSAVAASRADRALRLVHGRLE